MLNRVLAEGFGPGRQSLGPWRLTSAQVDKMALLVKGGFVVVVDILSCDHVDYD